MVYQPANGNSEFSTKITSGGFRSLATFKNTSFAVTPAASNCRPLKRYPLAGVTALILRQPLRLFLKLPRAQSTFVRFRQFVDSLSSTGKKDTNSSRLLVDSLIPDRLGS